MEIAGVISLISKLLALALPVLCYWARYRKGKSNGYAQGVDDERIRSKDEINAILQKNVTEIDNHNANMSVGKLHPSVQEDPH